jgi:hypothetical protein
MGAPDPIPLFGLGFQGKSRPAMAQRRVNLYYEQQQDRDRTQMVAYKTPGLDMAFVDFGATPCRGVIAPPSSDYAYFLHRDTFWQVDNAGTKTSRGTIGTSSGKVSMAQDGRYIGLVDGSKGYYYDMQTPATPIGEITDSDFPDGATDITWNDGFWLVELGDDFYQSDYQSITSWPGDFGSAESNPDDIMRLVADEDDVKIFGAQSLEFWQNTGNADFSYERIPGTTQKWGLAAKRSIAPLDDSFAFLTQNRQGQVIAAVLRGYKVQRISNHDLEAKWAAYGSFSDAVGGSYMLDGHPMYVVSFPIGGETWLYDATMPPGLGWSQLKSYGLTRHRGEIYFNFLGRNYVTDYDSGKVYRLNQETFTDAGDPIRWEIAGRHVFDGHRKIGIDTFQLDIETGVGLATGQGSDPEVMLRISRDGGRTFGIERKRTIGQRGQYKKRVFWKKCGRGRDFVFEVAGSDPVKTAILGAGIKVRQGSS